MSNIPKYLGKGSGWIINSVVNHTINISKYNSLAGSSYSKYPKELSHARKCLINIQNIIGACLDAYILQTIIQKELERSTNYMQTN